MMEKTFRVLGDEGEDGEGHGYSHSHSHSPAAFAEAKGLASGVSNRTNGELRSRKSKESEEKDEPTSQPSEVVHKTSKLSAYLNLFGDFTHNMCAVLRS